MVTFCGTDKSCGIQSRPIMVTISEECTRSSILWDRQELRWLIQSHNYSDSSGRMSNFYYSDSSGRMSKTTFTSDLPDSNVFHSDSKGSLIRVAQFEGIATDLDQIVEQSTHCSQWKGRGEESDVAKLDAHFQVVLKGIVILQKIKKMQQKWGSSGISTRSLDYSAYSHNWLTHHADQPVTKTRLKSHINLLPLTVRATSQINSPTHHLLGVVTHSGSLTHMETQTLTHAHTHMHARMLTHTHTHTQTHTHTNKHTHRHSTTRSSLTTVRTSDAHSGSPIHTCKHTHSHMHTWP